MSASTKACYPVPYQHYMLLIQLCYSLKDIAYMCYIFIYIRDIYIYVEKIHIAIVHIAETFKVGCL